ncbi:MAG TPA: hypothetical protein VHB20_19435 [Verrucomicrobiae bacterium]|jgi:hypothetical protein|nr:hypothetical protein [Verrucomicrobiae bacterium]
MSSTENWWKGEINWATPAGRLLDKFLAALPDDRAFHFVLFGSAPLQLSIDHALLSADVDLFSENEEEDLAALVEAAKLGKSQGGIYLEPGHSLSFRASPHWRARARSLTRRRATLTLPHPHDVLIGKLARLDAKDVQAFRRVMELTGHPTADEFKKDLQNAVDLFRPAFDDDSPNRYPENTRRLWREVFHAEIDLQRDIIAPALAKRRENYGETTPDYKHFLER